jgi:hypothetical protein
VRRAVRVLFEHNPFYLLSALCMLIGCYTLSRSLALRPGQIGKLLVLIGVLNVYEALVIGLALVLLRRGLARDACILLLVEAVFLLDGTFLNGEAFAADLAAGALVSAAVLALAVAKVLIVVRAAGWRMDRGVVFLLAELTVLLSLPGLFAARGSSISARMVYGAWWMAAALMVAQALVARTAPTAGARGEVEAAVRRGLAWGPHLSLAVHLIGLGWVHQVDFQFAYLAPLVLGVTAARMLALPSPAVNWRVPLLAIVLSLFADEGLVPASFLGVALSPARVIVVATGLTYLLGWWLHRLRAFAWGAAVCLGGPVLWLGVPMAWRAGDAAMAWLPNLMPRTAEQWGILAVVVAFALLGLGALVSFSGPSPGAPSGGGPEGPKP